MANHETGAFRLVAGAALGSTYGLGPCGAVYGDDGLLKYVDLYRGTGGGTERDRYDVAAGAFLGAGGAGGFFRSGGGFSGMLAPIIIFCPFLTTPLFFKIPGSYSQQAPGGGYYVVGVSASTAGPFNRVLHVKPDGSQALTPTCIPGGLMPASYVLLRVQTGVPKALAQQLNC